MHLDFRTIFIESSIILLAFTVFPLLVSRAKGIASRYLGLWSLAFPLLFAGTLAIAFRGFVPELLSILVSNLSIVLAYALLHAGMREYRGRRPNWKVNIGILFAMLLADTWFTVVEPSTQARVLLLSALSTLYFSLALAEVIALALRTRETVPIISGFFLFLLSLANIGRFILALLLGVPDDLLAAGDWDSLIQILSSAAVAGLSLSFLALHSSRLTRELAEAARGRELLMREMAHRTKNDLALVDSLIILEKNSLLGRAEAGTERCSESFDVLRDRIQCIAAAHSNLARSDEPGRVRLDRYLEELQETFPTDRVKLERCFEELEVSFSLAVPIGLVMNELMTNSLKHAFPSGRGGRIRLELASASVGEGFLSVEDNGVGTLWPSPKPGLGSEIIEALVAKIKGRLEYRSEGGSHWRLAFPLE